MRVHWHVLRPSQKVFQITKKKFHNVLQGVSPPDAVLQEAEKVKYLRWIAKNALFLEDAFRRSYALHHTVVVVVVIGISFCNELRTNCSLGA